MKLCVECGVKPREKGRRKCWKCRRPSQALNWRQRQYRKIEKVKCGRCGFVPSHVGQLDIDHVDGDSSNNDLTNLQVLCANCHRLKHLDPAAYAVIPKEAHHHHRGEARTRT